MKLFVQAINTHCQESGYKETRDRVEIYDDNYCFFIADKFNQVSYTLIYDKANKTWCLRDEDIGEVNISESVALGLTRNFLNDEGSQWASDLLYDC